MDILVLSVIRPKLSNMSHITVEQRYTISVMKQQNYSQKAIAQAIGKDKSVVSRELKRNCDCRNGEYRYDLAQRKYEQRLSEKPKRIKFTDELAGVVSTYLAQKFSPEQIVGYCKKEGIEMVSVERIYQHIWSDKKQKGRLYEHLRTQGKRYRKRGSSKDKRGIIKDKVPISARPAIVEQRERFGDLEIDTIIGKDHKGAIITINDRATGVVKMIKTNGKNADDLAQNVIEKLQDWKPYLHTITSDNGKEFAQHKRIAEALNIDYFFARPYQSWERGSNENLNGLIRQYIPKKSCFDDITEAHLSYIEKQLNNRPRKRFNYENPITIFNQKVAFIT